MNNNHSPLNNNPVVKFLSPIRQNSLLMRFLSSSIFVYWVWYLRCQMEKAKGWIWSFWEASRFKPTVFIMGIQPLSRKNVVVQWWAVLLVTNWFSSKELFRAFRCRLLVELSMKWHITSFCLLYHSLSQILFCSIYLLLTLRNIS